LHFQIEFLSFQSSFCPSEFSFCSFELNFCLSTKKRWTLMAKDVCFFVLFCSTLLFKVNFVVKNLPYWTKFVKNQGFSH